MAPWIIEFDFSLHPIASYLTPSGCDALYLITHQNKSKLPNLRLSILGHPL